VVAGRREGRHDPLEGISPSGVITTGVSRTRVRAEFEPVVAAAADSLVDAGQRVAVYLYGSVATGRAVVSVSDVDVLTIGLSPTVAADVASTLSRRFSSTCSAVEVAAAQPADLSRANDESYGLRVFVRHYCVHVAGPRFSARAEGYPPDRRAARGFNGDIDVHAARWRAAIAAGEDPAGIGRRVARKTLLAVAGLVSMHDEIWTTDREFAAERWAEIDPLRAAGLAELATWTSDPAGAGRDDVLDALDRTVAPIVERFASTIGLWS
jgi:hypothetical protein